MSATSFIDAVLRESQSPTEPTDYWNVESFLAEEEFIPCVFKIDCKNLGYLDQAAAATQQLKSQLEERPLQKDI